MFKFVNRINISEKAPPVFISKDRPLRDKVCVLVHFLHGNVFNSSRGGNSLRFENFKVSDLLGHFSSSTQASDKLDDEPFFHSCCNRHPWHLVWTSCCSSGCYLSANDARTHAFEATTPYTHWWHFNEILLISFDALYARWYRLPLVSSVRHFWQMCWR